jgi:molybdenum cofactor cytidylyltransferase
MRAELTGLDATPVVSEGWAEGMGSSLRRGMEAVCGMKDQPAGALVLVCDQPKVTLEHLRRLLAEQDGREARITASEYAGRLGVPAVFGRGFFAELLEMEGDRGAREVIRRHSASVNIVPCPEGEADVDRLEDLERLQGT